ncbi:MAG: family 16 glycosylhydrolase [Clostridia bacterium]|nr:family 16 glycosylhydrolase [Clostridia bacterium]
MKRTLVLILAFVLCFSLLVGCGGSEGTNSETTSNSGSENIFSTEDVKFAEENGESRYSIIRPNGEADANVSASYLFKQIKNTLNINIKSTTDENDGADAYEILVGRTNRPESEQARKYLINTNGGRIQDFIICTIGKKIVIMAMNNDYLDDACKYFVENYVKADGVKGGINYISKTAGNFVDADINGVKPGMFVFVKQRYNQSYITQKQIEAANELFMQKIGYFLEVVEDNVAAAEYEVIIGDANRDGVEKITDKDTYAIKIAGKKVYLNGGSPASKAMAVSEFAKMLSEGSVTDASSKTGNYAADISKYDMTNYYTLKWADDFDMPSSLHETGIDLSKWAWGTDSAAGCNGRTSVRSQSSDHLYVANGMLNFYAAYDDANYYGFKLLTKERMRYRYGVLEMSAILPHSNGSGFWISLWANSHDPDASAAFFTEVNVVEMFGNSGSEASNLHGWLKSAQRPYYSNYWEPQGVAEHWSLDGKFSGDKRYACPEGKFNDGLHTFTYIWEKDECSFACDGNVYFTINPESEELWTETFNQPIYLILSQATCFEQQLTCPADDDPVWQTSNNFQIDYVHIYQLDKPGHEVIYWEN